MYLASNITQWYKLSQEGLPCLVALPLTGVLFFSLLHVSVGPDEVGKHSVVVHEVVVGAHLCDAAAVHHHYLVTLREEPNTVGDQDTDLKRGRGGGEGRGGEGRGEGREGRSQQSVYATRRRCKQA